MIVNNNKEPVRSHEDMIDYFMIKLKQNFTKMATFSTDRDGQRIVTDILVAGYIRNISKQYNLAIPHDINGICFEFWIIRVSDEWDQSLIGKHIKIDGQLVQLSKDRKFGSCFGCYSISKGTHSWTVKFGTDIDWVVIGIIEDDPTTLAYVANHNPFDMTDCGHWILNLNEYFGDRPGYHPEVRKSGSTVTVTVDMDNHSLSYKVNDTECGVATNELNKEKYRFMITFFYSDDVIELL